ERLFRYGCAKGQPGPDSAQRRQVPARQGGRARFERTPRFGLLGMSLDLQATALYRQRPPQPGCKRSPAIALYRSRQLRTMSQLCLDAFYQARLLRHLSPAECPLDRAADVIQPVPNAACQE